MVMGVESRNFVVTVPARQSQKSRIGAYYAVLRSNRTPPRERVRGAFQPGSKPFRRVTGGNSDVQAVFANWFGDSLFATISDTRGFPAKRFDYHLDGRSIPRRMLHDVLGQGVGPSRVRQYRRHGA